MLCNGEAVQMFHQPDAHTDGIREYVKRGMTLDQVKARKPTLDFDPRYGTTTGFWTTDMFIEVIYKQMLAANPPAWSRPASSPRPTWVVSACRRCPRRRPRVEGVVARDAVRRRRPRDAWARRWT
jgi:hypothetical protein